MKKFFTIWGGHLLGLLALIFAGFACYFAYRAVTAEDTDSIFVFGIAAIVVGIVAFCVGAVAAYHWNTRGERRGLRAGTLVLNRWVPPGRAK